MRLLSIFITDGELLGEHCHQAMHISVKSTTHHQFVQNAICRQISEQAEQDATLGPNRQRQLVLISNIPEAAKDYTIWSASREHSQISSKDHLLIKTTFTGPL